MTTSKNSYRKSIRLSVRQTMYLDRAAALYGVSKSKPLLLGIETGLDIENTIPLTEEDIINFENKIQLSNKRVSITIPLYYRENLEGIIARTASSYGAVIRYFLNEYLSQFPEADWVVV